MLVASVLGSAAFAAPSGSSDLNSWLLSGEILVFAPGDTALPANAHLAPLGERTDRAARYAIQGLSSAARDGSGFQSTPLLRPTSPLVIGDQRTAPIEIGNLSLQHDPDGWVLYAIESESQGRPIFRLVDTHGAEGASVDGDFALAGELQLHETMADELGLRGATLPPSLTAGAFTLVASRTRGAGVAIASAPTGPQPAALPPPPSVPGPDVIVSGVGGTTLLKHGTVGTITGYTVQTVSCNIGTQNAEWFQFTADHPVIGTQLYRLKTVNGSTRFEQLGMSWLKHGFCAADASNCGQTPTPNASCDWLGLWSTDTYTASRNGQQTNLGPRSEINAWAGTYPYPFVLGAGQTGNAIFKRCQVENAELDPALNAGAQYVTEVVYICTDEPDGNKYNNYSNKMTTVGAISGGGYPLSIAGSTNREQAAIQRWPILDAGVTLVNVDTPSDGRFIVGAKATDLGGGQWHYEYAVFNMNNHDSARSLSVPADSSVTVTNVEFHDVNYHSGEPYSLTDWTPSRSATDQSWSTSTFASNPNANALRWSTTYNFRFDANAAPVTGNLTLGLFRSAGSATAVGVPVPGSGGPINTAYCFGDASGTACPCGNFSSPPGAAGCVNSLLIAGSLTIGGTPSISADTLTLQGSGMPNGPCLYFQGTAQVPLGSAFGDGLMCVGGTITRLGVEFNSVAGTSTYPSGANLPVSVQGLVTTPGVRTYQSWYRDSDPGFCTVSTFNLTSGFQVIWLP